MGPSGAEACRGQGRANAGNRGSARRPKDNDEGAGLKLLSPIYGWFTEGLGTHDLREAKVLPRGTAVAGYSQCASNEPFGRPAAACAAAIAVVPVWIGAGI